MKKTLRFLQHLENWLLVITFSVMVIAIFIQVVNRNIFKIPVSGFEEAAKYCMVYMVMLGTELGLRDGSQIAITGVVEKFHGKARKALQIISKLIVVCFAGVMTNTSLNIFVQEYQCSRKSSSIGNICLGYINLIPSQ